MKGKRITVFVLSFLFVFTALLVSGCADNGIEPGQLEELNDENRQLEDSISELEQEIADLTNQLTEAQAAAPAEYGKVLGLNCLVYPEGADRDSAAGALKFQEPTAVTAAAVIGEGMALDFWCVNGVPAEEQGDILTVNVDTDTVIEAAVRPELKVSSINASMQFLDEKGKAEGDKFTEYVFEYDTEKVSGKLISVYVSADIPKDYEIDYWLINGVPYHFSRAVTAFTVFDLDETTVYEAVLQKTAATPTPTPKATAAPTATPKPAMVTVSCTNATFSGGGYANAASGSVPKGTTITVTGTSDIGNPQYWIINGANYAITTYGKTFTFTVNVNTSFQYTGYN